MVLFVDGVEYIFIENGVGAIVLERPLEPSTLGNSPLEEPEVLNRTL